MSLQTLQATKDLLEGQLRDLTVAMRAAVVQSKSSNTAIAAAGRQALEAFRTQYKALLVRIDQLRDAASEEEAPSSFMLALSDFSERASAVARDTGAIVPKLTDTVQNVAKALPWILGIVLLVAVLYFVRTFAKEGRG